MIFGKRQKCPIGRSRDAGTRLWRERGGQPADTGRQSGRPKSPLPLLCGKIKCIFIDPPYNTRKDFEHYQDNLEHAQWLEMMYPRLELLHELLADDGSIWVIIDDDEGHYLKVLMDEIFGRKNFVANVVWQKKFSPQNDTKWLSDSMTILSFTLKVRMYGDHCFCPERKKWTKDIKILIMTLAVFGHQAIFP